MQQTVIFMAVKLYFLNEKTQSYFFCLKNIDCGYSLEQYYFNEAVLMSTHNLCFNAAIRKIIYTPVNHSLTL